MQAHDVLQGIYESNKHPAGDETWKDPRGLQGASLQLDSESQVPQDLLETVKARSLGFEIGANNINRIQDTSVCLFDLF